MSLSRSPSPAPGGGWSSPGLDINTSGRSSPNKDSPVWSDSPTMRASPASFNQGFFTRHMRKLSSSLPRFNHEISYAEREKAGRNGRWSPGGGGFLSRLSRRTKSRLLFVLSIVMLVWLWNGTPLYYHFRKNSYLGGGDKFVIVIGSNVGGGVMEWKGAREWAIERDSLRNKKKYVRRFGYNLEIADMKTRKKYAHEWRESWEKVDFIRNAMRKYPNAEWFWWVDLNTYIMEPKVSLQKHLFNNLDKYIYRDINQYNPLNITHPFTDEYLDVEDRSLNGDGKLESINMILAQDCSGFNLGSFFIRRGPWADRLLDVWWDPVLYEQKHMAWEHKEQDALEQLYTTQPWVRKHVAFVPQRMINSFPTGACGDAVSGDQIHYDQKDRDFLINMAGCEWGRDCWGEMYNYRELSYYLNRSIWERFKEDLVAVVWYKLTGQKVKL
ncbi:hypothetical protein BROUX41_001430 [Berkeleyomyces rouxiae]|uniref:uncharacterized protein n=1 Tax=Berkeleyomyces rouxiae TaxID=2035830 RepID=UPI003B8243D5